jgi:hypothetical protein
MIQDFKDVHKGETCIVVGNGPSLEQTPLWNLRQQYLTFGANKIYGLEIIPDFWTCVDQVMLTDCIPWVIAQPASSFLAHKFVPRDVPLPGSHQLNISIESGFSKDAAEKVILGGTVTYVNLQLAWYMGFTTVLLVGVDHKYPKASIGGKAGYKFIAEDDDPDHFKLADGSPYFTPGRLYNRPELTANERYYAAAKMVFEQAGRKIVNLTPGSALNIFPKSTFEEWL